MDQSIEIVKSKTHLKNKSFSLNYDEDAPYDKISLLRFALTLAAESLTVCLFLIQNCGMGNPLLVQVMIVWPFFMGLTLLVFIIFNFIDNFILDFPTAEEVATLASQH